jgi:putative protease
MERLHSAILFGADAVYLSGKRFGMRAGAGNFTDEDIEKAIETAHKNAVSVYVTCNIVPRNEDVKQLPEFLEKLEAFGADAVIVGDIGVLRMAKQYAPNTDIHISTQAGVANYVTANEFYEMGASRVVLARELNISDIAEIRAKTPRELELEAFVHGSMCVSFSGRCLLSSYLTGRDANKGECAQPCRWQYALCEAKRPGEYFPIFEDTDGTHILNSRDMCLAEHIPELVGAGIGSFKVEGRAKSSYYVAVVTNAYRAAIDGYFKNPSPDYVLEDWIKEEFSKVSHREYSEGFYFGNEPGQEINDGGYVRDYEVSAVVTECRNGYIYATQRNKFSAGDLLDVLPPRGKPCLIRAEGLEDGEGNSIMSAPHAMMPIRIKSDIVLPSGSLMRRKR